MKNIFKLLSVTAFVLVIAFAMTACHSEDKPDPDPDSDPQTPLTGTVSVTSALTINVGEESMKLTADASGLNSSYYSYRWIRDGAEISGARSSTYDVTPADYGKALRVKVTSSVNSGEQFGDFTVPSPTTLTLTLKWDNAAQKKDTGIIIERENGGYWKGAQTSGNLTTTGSTIILTSWQETKFKMRTEYTLIGTKYYFQKDNASGSELFDLTNGTKTYTLTNKFATSVLYDLFATEG
jgi:hypothetical protein